MLAYNPLLISVTLVSFFATLSPSQQSQVIVTDHNTFVCHGSFMSVYIPKVLSSNLPSSIYVHDEHSGYYQAVAVAKQCLYSLEETENFVILTVASHGCFVRRKKHVTNLDVVIMALADRGRVEIIESISVTCDRTFQEHNKDFHPLESRSLSCNKDGFNITILQNATVPHLNLDEISIPSNQNQNCLPKKRSKDAVTFSFPFTDCGTQSVTEDRMVTYWVKLEVKKRSQRSSIFRDTPFHLIVHCSFKLAEITQLNLGVHAENSLTALKNMGPLSTAMRFAKDSSYRTFYSSREPPTVTELGQPVYVDVFVLKHEDKDLTLLLQDCWATPTENPHDRQRWSLLVRGCPFVGDNHRTVVLPVVSSKELKYPSLHKWFVVKLFSFVKPPTLENLVYFHCDVEICKGSDCSPSCSTGRRKSRITPGPEKQILHVVSGGPLLYLL